MRAMTFNLRFENDRDGENAWSLRRDLVVGVVRRYAPGLLGTQEGKLTQLRFLEEHLPEYAMHTRGRVEDEFCQYPTLFFRKDRFSLEEGGELWLSETPTVHRSKSWDSAFPRMMQFTRLRAADMDGTLWVVVTHLDHLGVRARLEQAYILARWVRDRRGPVVLMGDFNDTPGSPAHQALTAPEVGLADTWETLGRAEDKQSLTHHGFAGVPQKTRMDWILARQFRAKDAKVVRDHAEGLYPSDHYPYMADLELYDSP